MNYTRFNCNQPSSVAGKKMHDDRCKWIMDIIEGTREAEIQRSQRELDKKENQRWVIKIIQMLKEEFKDDDSFFARLEDELFTKWGKYQIWKKVVEKKDSLETDGIYFLRTFFYVHTDIQRVCVNWPVDLTERTKKVIHNAYYAYEELTGIHIKIL